jgi:hypothetical protein
MRVPIVHKRVSTLKPSFAVRSNRSIIASGAVRASGFSLRFSPGYMREVEHIELLTKKKLQILFPEAQAQPVNLANALTAFHVA